MFTRSLADRKHLVHRCEQLACHHTAVTTFDELWHHIEAAWTSVSVHVTQSLFDAMPRRDFSQSVPLNFLKI
ncbi:hypothetical protein TNCV_71691 [Trichonephila clavipes]|nr:hypothetical protein TNCV_71691 [Trichonephila clavipes]